MKEVQLGPRCATRGNDSSLERCVNFSNGIFGSSFTVLLHAPSLRLRFQRALAEIREITDETAATTTIAAAMPTAIFQSPSTGLGIT